jgi:hypothetical protein
MQCNASSPLSIHILAVGQDIRIYSLSRGVPFLLQLRGVLDKVLGDESDMKAIHLTGK